MNQISSICSHSRDVVQKIILPTTAQMANPLLGIICSQGIHKGACKYHIGGRTIAHRALTLGYYWPSMKMDAQQLVQKCDRCQRFVKYSHHPPQPMTPF